jgi:hypothetical protein
MDIQQAVLLQIYAGLEELGIRTALGWRMGAPGDLLTLDERWGDVSQAALRGTPKAAA